MDRAGPCGRPPRSPPSGCSSPAGSPWWPSSRSAGCWQPGPSRRSGASPGPSRTRDLAVVLALLGPPLTALGFALLPVLQVVGAAVMTAALWTWAVAAGGVVAPGASGARRWGIARLSVLASMPLALWWATGTVVGFSVPSIPTMAATHGVLNAVGFAACGLWALHTAGVRPTPAARVARRR